MMPSNTSISSVSVRLPGIRAVVRIAAVCLALLCLSLTCLAQGGGKQYALGHVLLKFHDNITAAQQQAVLARMHAKAAHHLGHLKVNWVDLPAPGQEATTVAFLKQQPEVEFAELDARLKLTQTDPGFASQWHLPNIAANLAWNVTTGSANVIVAILDSGCDPTHPDLVPNYVAGWNFYDNNSDTHDVFGHGTAVAGCVGARGNNSLGIASVSWYSKLMPIRVTDTAGYAYSSTLSSGLQWAADHGAKVANMSFGSLLGSSTVISAAQYFHDKGGLVCISAGNAGTNEGYSASPYMIAVSATTSANTIASWSSYGNYVTVTAPGNSIYTTNNGGGYAYWSGTSFSSPITCGVIAEIWAANPYLTNAQVQSILTSTTDDLGTAGWDIYYGSGKVNVNKAVLQAQTTTVDLTAPTVSISSPANGGTDSGMVAITTAASDNVAVSKVEMYADGVLIGTSTTAPYNFSWNTMNSANGSHTLMAKAYDTSNNTGTSTIAVTVSNAVDTTAPTVSITSPATGTKVGNSLSVSATASDDKGVVKVELWVDGKLNSTDTAPAWSFSLNTRKWVAGTHTLQCKAYDAAGNVGLSQIVSVTK